MLAVTNWEAFHKAREVMRAALADSTDAPEGPDVERDALNRLKGEK